MTESEWLASEDPAVMLSLLTDNTVGPGSPVAWRQSMPGNGIDRLSDRKLRLFACACVRLEWGALTDQRSRDAVTTSEAYAEGMVSSDGLYEASFAAWSVCDEKRVPMYETLAEHWAWMASGRDAEIPKFLLNNDRPGSLSDQAAILRDIVGNPFRPVTLPYPYITPARCGYEFEGEYAGTVCGCDTPSIGMSSWPAERRERQWACSTYYHVQDKQRGPCPWLTPQVLSLAQAAYEERGKPCRRCKGRGTLQEKNPWIGDWSVDVMIYAVKCAACNGTGTIDDGTLDPFRLALLADALEEAGCAGTECPNCVDGDIGCPKCEGTGYFYAPAYSLNRLPCDNCVEGLLADKCTNCAGNGLIPHPLLAHLRSPGVHYRGCWALDLILGKE